MTWTDAKDDALIYSTTQALINKIAQAAQAAGLGSGFEYLNYAAGFQDPIKGYGAASFGSLREVARKYDPLGFFQTGVPGGFKLV